MNLVFQYSSSGKNIVCVTKNKTIKKVPLFHILKGGDRTVLELAVLLSRVRSVRSRFA